MYKYGTQMENKRRIDELRALVKHYRDQRDEQKRLVNLLVKEVEKLQKAFEKMT